mgnify:CR=1 FL=1
MIRISSIICTLNRADYLRKAIKSLVEQTLATESYEILVVDNGSSDATKQVVIEEFSQVQNLRYIYEPIMGLSQARNTGLANATGEYIAYLDDDAIASPQWLEKIVEVFDTVKPQLGCVGGKVEPIWEAPRPSWLPDQLMTYLTTLDYSKTPVNLDNTPCRLTGANIAFPKHLLQTLGGFQVDLGRRGNNLLSSEESFIQEQLLEKGYSCFYHPEIAVGHHIPASRLTKDFFVNRLYWEGVSKAIAQIHQKAPSNLQRLQMIIPIALRISRSPWKIANLAIPTNNPERFARKCLTLSNISYIMGLLGVVK